MIERATQSPLFPRGANTLLRVGAALVLGALVAVPVFFLGWSRTSYANGSRTVEPQPVLFDHRHHTRDDGIDCRYCHHDVERGPSAGVPTAALCMGCHAQIWQGASLLAPIQESAATGTAIQWQRVFNVPDFVFFDHSAHVRRNVGCVSCHGRVDQMPGVYMPNALTMQFCLDCHRDPAAHLRPADRITDPEWSAGEGQRALGQEIQRREHIEPPLHCSGCHR